MVCAEADGHLFSCHVKQTLTLDTLDLFSDVERRCITAKVPPFYTVYTFSPFPRLGVQHAQYIDEVTRDHFP